VSIAIQFTSHVLPPSFENDCSKRHDVGVMSDITNRTRIDRPLNVSWLKNSPRPFLNSPIDGCVSVPSLMFAKLRLHWRDWGLYRRRLRPSKCPAWPSALSSTRLARPFQTFHTTVVPSYSTQVVEPVRGRWSRLRWVFQVPISKSKSCCPSRSRSFDVC
jgi:hypothetical protein